MLTKNSKIFLAGHTGLVGSAILRFLKKKNYKNIVTASSSKINFLDQSKTCSFLKRNKFMVKEISSKEKDLLLLQK